ncbi:MAG: hypothetical protein M1816_000568 [Peltula sp. TS41687]|nr:MAG: hypothetical protein M1816_000568 [Peltula sp. TS41687]
MAEEFLLHVTAGPSYDASTHTTVNVNSSSPLPIHSALADVNLNVRIQNYRGLPRDSPRSSPYFSHQLHTHDQYSIGFQFVPKSTISGNALVFGNDFDHPIRDRLPPGFGKALKIVKWSLDPGLDGDPYADKPYLYGPALSSINILRVGEKQSILANGRVPPASDGVIEEGADGNEQKVREEKGVPKDAAARKKWFLDEMKRKQWDFEAGRVFHVDFFNPYLDFNEFALKLPGFSLPILKYLDTREIESRSLRYVLKNRDTGDVLFVVVFTLLKLDEVEKLEAETKGDRHTVEGKPDGETFEPSADDVD